MKPLTRLILLAILVAAVAPCGRALPDAEATAGRLILRHYADAIVSVKLTLVLRVTVNDRAMPPNESNVDINGTMISPAGLTVTSFNSVDAKALFEVLKAQAGATGAGVTLNSSEIKNLRLQLADGTELPATLVGKDPNRDLAFIAPEANGPGRTFTCVDLAGTPAPAIVLGDYFELSRLGDTMQRMAIVRPSTVVGIKERPRRLILTTTDNQADALGCPVFDSKGRVLGVCMRFLVDGSPKGNVLVPTSDVLEQSGLQ